MSMENKPESVKTVPFREAKVGDFVMRMLAGTIPVPVRVIGITEDRINCGWEFDRQTGREIDDDIPVLVSHLV